MAFTEDDRRFLDLAIEAARTSMSQGGIPIGAALVHDGTVLAVGHNCRVQKGSAILHAETDTIERAGRQPATVYRNSTLYTTLSPCFMCAGAALLYEIPRIVIGENRTFEQSESLLRDKGIELVIVDDVRCKELMDALIANSPELWSEDIGVESVALESVELDGTPDPR